MFIDLVGSTTLSQQLDPEDYHGRVVAYQTACRQVIARYEGHIAQYLGDGVLVYFGYRPRMTRTRCAPCAAAWRSWRR